MKTQYNSYTVEEHTIDAIIGRILLRKKESPQDTLFWVDDEGIIGSVYLINIESVGKWNSNTVYLLIVGREEEREKFIDYSSLFWTYPLAVAHLESGKRT